MVKNETALSSLFDLQIPTTQPYSSHLFFLHFVILFCVLSLIKLLNTSLPSSEIVGGVVVLIKEDILNFPAPDTFAIFLQWVVDYFHTITVNPYSYSCSFIQRYPPCPLILSRQVTGESIPGGASGEPVPWGGGERDSYCSCILSLRGVEGHIHNIFTP